MKEQSNITNSLAHTKRNCKYHIVFVPEYRRKVFYKENGLEIREKLRKYVSGKANSCLILLLAAERYLII